MGDRINRSNTRLRAAGCVVMASVGITIDAFHGDRSAIAATIGPIGEDDEVP